MAENQKPTGDNKLLSDTISVREITRLERWLGPDNYRVVMGLFKTPASVIGLSLLSFFILIAIFAPVIVPVPEKGDPYKIPRDGFKADPQPPMTPWKKNAPELPFWWKPIMKTDQ